MSEAIKVYGFENVALYLRGTMFGINRTDCKTVRILTGQRYAQYNDAIRVTFLEKGKRKERTLMLDYQPWLRVVALPNAITPADPLVADGSGSRQSRYASCDPRWATDFEDALAAAGTPLMLSIGEGVRKPVEPEVDEEPLSWTSVTA